MALPDQGRRASTPAGAAGYSIPGHCHLARSTADMPDQAALPMNAPTNPLAVVSLVFGILTWCLLPFVGALVAVVCGHLARSEMRRAPPQAGDGMALAGLVLGYVHLAVCVLGVLVMLGALLVGVHLFWP
jgi:hypothetical protein